MPNVKIKLTTQWSKKYNLGYFESQLSKNIGLKLYNDKIQ